MTKLLLVLNHDGDILTAVPFTDSSYVPFRALKEVLS